jgi:holo-[acyl-carrier protein] synthase/NAD(P)H-hydrate epimerase
MVDVMRFSKLLLPSKRHLLKKLFTEGELAYALLHVNTGERLAGMFALKEAVSKALGVYEYPVSLLEIRHNKDGAPLAYHKNKKLSIRVSITHTKDVAAAIAVV